MVKGLRRCMWFNDDGYPLVRFDERLGCLRPETCLFVHPEDPDWPMAMKSYHPDGTRNMTDAEKATLLVPAPLSNRPQPTLTSRIRSPPRPRSPLQRPRSPPPRPRSPPTRPRSPPPRGRSPPPLSRARTPPPRGRTPPPRVKSPPRSITPLGIAPLAPRALTPPRSRVSSGPPPRSPYTPPREHRPSEAAGFWRNDPSGPRREMAGPGHSREPSAGRHAAAQDGRNFRLQASSSHPHLGEDVKPSLLLAARMPPPPPLRSSSNVAPNGHQAPRPGPSNQTEVSYEERRAMWAERVKLLSEAVAARSEYVKLQEELESMQRLSRSVRFDEVLEEDKARMDARISSLTSQCDAKKTELNRMLVRLTDADFWPVGQKMPPTLEDGHAAMQTTINELKKSLASLYKLIEDTRADFAKSRETQATAFTDSEGNQTTEPRAAKRRRLSSGDDTLVEDEDRKRAMVTAAEVDELRGKLLEVERQLADVQNEMVQHDNELLQEIEDLVHSRLEDIPGSASTSRGGRAPDNDPKKQRDNVLDHIRRDLDSTGNDILSLAQEVAGLIKQMNAKDQEQTNLRLENEQLKQRVEALEQQHILDMEDFHANRLEMQALNTAVSTFLSQPHPSPPTLPPQPLFEEIAKDIHPVLKHLLSEDLKPLLQESHQKVSNMLQESTVNAWRDILSRLKPTIKSAEVVAALINQVHGNGEEDMAEQSVFSKMSH